VRSSYTEVVILTLTGSIIFSELILGASFGYFEAYSFYPCDFERSRFCHLLDNFTKVSSQTGATL
jgi:hypothetical protein